MVIIRLTIYLILITGLKSIIFFNECDSNCICDKRDFNLTIRCYMQFTAPFRLPSPSNIGTDTARIIVKESYLTNYPLDICLYSNMLIYLDLSDNLISQSLNSTFFSCLTNLEYLNLSNNSISIIDENSFDYLNNLKELDLSYNRIVTIPTNLFYFKLENLVYLNLKNNEIKELDVWMLFLRNINHIDLSYNQIGSFINKIGWNPYYVSPIFGLKNAKLIDLTFNNLTNFDDDILRLFSICTPNEFRDFLNLFNKLSIENNNINCDCQKSYNTLSFFQEFITRNTIKSNNYLFFHKCSSPSQYYDKNIFSFADPNDCSAVQFNRINCGYGTTTTTTKFDNITISKLNKILGFSQESFNYFDEVQIAGYALGLIGFLIFFLAIVYFNCPIEIHALCFNYMPLLYWICSCKSDVKTNKEYDLFISYNKVNEYWVRKKLLPFIKKKHLIESYMLHYNMENRKCELFGDYIKTIMNKSNCILFVLSDAFLMREWNDERFREHLRYLITKEKTKFISIQMHDVYDEEVEEYFIQKLQVPRFISLERDELLFWNKLAYFLYTTTTTNNNRKLINFGKNKIQNTKSLKSSINSRNEKFSSALFFKNGTPISSASSFDQPSTLYFTEDSSIYNSSTCLNPKQKLNIQKNIFMNKMNRNILLNTRKPVIIHDNNVKIFREFSNESLSFDPRYKMYNNNKKTSERHHNMNNFIFQQRNSSNKNESNFFTNVK